ncbi:MAG TPA: glycoside hydrolase family 44 protein [Vicinamibacteria bacterium]|nr:glycoside hydrolase family 44 protein [Vicinamibacteria bacterium]
MRTADRALLALLVLAAAHGVSAQTATIAVDASADQHPIDPAVYGVAYATPAQLIDLRVTAHRRGGNNTSRYNWQQNADNRGNDWFYQSIAYQSATAGADVDDFIAETRAGNSEPMVTIPMVGWVAKLGSNRSKLASFSAAKYGAQTNCDWQWYPDACNGILASNGQYVQNNDKNDANVPADGAFHEGWFDHLVARWGTAASGGLRYYILDNEYSIWHATHRDVHPVGAGMDEVRDKMVDFATRIKNNDPGALVVAPEEWGWTGYLYSGYDSWWASTHGWGNLPDRAAHGGWDYVPWLLDQMRQREVATGRRLLDVFSLHYYPQGGEFSDDVSSAMQQRRNRSTRSLWDPNYIDETLINDRVRLIPRMRQWASQYYPNTPIAITEYNWGAEGHINGATTQADVLGIFGRERLDIGARWATPDTATPTYKAIKMYRNYDGAGGAFGDTSVRATAPDPDNLSAFAARRTADGALTVMLVAKRLTGTTATTVSLANFQAAGPVQVWRLGSSNAIAHLPDATAAAGAVTLSLPPQTITLLVIAPQTVLPGTVTLADVSVVEGNAGTVSAGFDVVRTGGAGTTATVSYATQNGTATAGTDYVAASGTLTFGPADTSLPVNVTVNGDTIDEANERFLLHLSAPNGVTITQPDGWATIVDDDGGSRPLQEIGHGTYGRHDFASGPDHLYVLRQEAYSSYEVVVDAAFGRGGSATGPQLDRLAADGVTPVQASIGAGTGRARHLRWLHDSSAPQTGQYVRVRAGSCTSGCTAGDGYRIRFYDTTCRIPRFNNGGTQSTVLLLQNPTTRTVNARARFWSASGVLLHTQSITLAPRTGYSLATASVGALAGQGGSVTVASDAGYGELVGKAVSVDAANGLTFDTPMVPRPR